VVGTAGGSFQMQRNTRQGTVRANKNNGKKYYTSQLVPNKALMNKTMAGFVALDRLLFVFNEPTC